MRYHCDMPRRDESFVRDWALARSEHLLGLLVRYVMACTARGVTVHKRGKPPNPSGAAFMTRVRFENDRLPRTRLCGVS